MRFLYPNLTRPKKAARRLADLLPGVGLARSREAVARAIGYRDWHELEGEHAKQEPSPLDQTLSSEAFVDQAFRLAGKLSDVLQLPNGETQYALSRSRLVGDRAWSPEDHIAIRIRFWREQFGPPGRGRPGTIVKIRERKEVGYLCELGQPSRILYDTSVGVVADFEVITPRVPRPMFVPLRLWLPYGYWTLADGSEVLFSRDYLPLWRVSPTGVERLPPWLWIDEKEEHTWFKDEGRANWAAPHVVAAATERLCRHGITGLPRLADALPYFFEEGVERAATAAKRMMDAHRYEPAPIGPFHVRWKYDTPD